MGKVVAYKARVCSQSCKTRSRRKSRTGAKLNKDECAFCHERGYWKKDYPKLKKNDKGKVAFDTCVAKCGDDLLDFALVGMPTTSYINEE